MSIMMPQADEAVLAAPFTLVAMRDSAGSVSLSSRAAAQVICCKLCVAAAIGPLGPFKRASA